MPCLAGMSMPAHGGPDRSLNARPAAMRIMRTRMQPATFGVRGLALLHGEVAGLPDRRTVNTQGKAGSVTRNQPFFVRGPYPCPDKLTYDVVRCGMGLTRPEERQRTCRWCHDRVRGDPSTRSGPDGGPGTDLGEIRVLRDPSCQERCRDRGRATAPLQGVLRGNGRGPHPRGTARAA